MSLKWKTIGLLVTSIYLAECTWFKYQLREVNCDEADQVNCETSLYWSGQCKICRECYNVCPECRDDMLYCKQLTAFTKKECDEPGTDIYSHCPKTCGKCKCNRTVRDVHDNFECQRHFEKVAARKRSLKEEL